MRSLVCGLLALLLAGPSQSQTFGDIPAVVATTGSGATVLATKTTITGVTLVGPYTQAVRVVTGAGSISVTAADMVVVVNKASGAATAVSLPAGTTGLTFTIKDGKGDAAANNITITPAAGTIDGAATLVISTNFGVARLVYNGTQWNQI